MRIVKSSVIIPRIAMFQTAIQNESLLKDCAETVNRLLAQCVENTPNFRVGEEVFRYSLGRATQKFLSGDSAILPTQTEIENFLGDLQIADLYLALACANGCENAWWEFDRQFRPYLQRVARHLASAETDAEEVIDAVYVELYGTKIVDGVRQSKFASYSGRGTLKGWLRTVVWHALVDLHRTSHDEVSLDEMTENVGEGQAHANFLVAAHGGESEMLDDLTRRRYRDVTVNSLRNAFTTLDDHEKLLLLYYHVENLKMREISKLVEAAESPLRNWFQRKSDKRAGEPEARVHESTVMRWLEKTYAKVLQSFRTELKEKHCLKETEIAQCMSIVTQDLAHGEIKKHLLPTVN